MRRLRAWFLRLAGLLNKQRRERDLADELESHLQLHIEDNLRSGMSPVEARRQALIKLGGVEQTKEIYRDRRGFPLVESLIQDIRYGLRMLAKSPAFTAIALLTLALGIGGTTAIFSVVYGVLIDPWPYRDSDRLAVLMAYGTAQPWQNWARVSAREFLDYQQQNHVFAEVIGITSDDVRLTGSGTAEYYNGRLVTTNTFRVLDVPPLLGRAFTDEDGKPGAAPVVMLGYKVWQGKFGGDPGIVGKTLTLNHQPTTVIGVVPPRLPSDLWLPTTISRAEARPDRRYSFEARLKPGVSFEQATADIAVLAKRFAKVYPNDHKDVIFTVESLTFGFTRHLRPTWGILLGAVGLLLVIACVNVANLLLARATGRQREFAIRASLGASHIRLVRQIMVESLLLALGGAALGCAVAWPALVGLLAIVPEQYMESSAVVRINGPVLLFSLGTALVSALLFGIAPALGAARADLQEPLNASSRGSGESRGHGRLRRLLVVSEVALSLVLLTGGGLLIRSFFAFRYADLGYNPDNFLEGAVTLPEERYKTAEQRKQFCLELLRRVRALPGVISATVNSIGSAGEGALLPMEIAGKPSAGRRSASLAFSDDHFFETMGIQLLQGRTISEEDMVHARKVAVINRALATKYFGGENPLGRQIKLLPAMNIGDWPPPALQVWFEVVGVVADTRNSNNIGKAVTPMVCVPSTVFVEGVGMDPLFPLVVRTVGEPARMVIAVRRTLTEIDKDVSMDGPRPVRELMDKTWYTEPRFVLTMFVAFASLGLVLVSIGVYGVLSYHASQRTHEIGIRMALGAQAAEVRWLVLMAGLRSLLVGIAIGVPASIALAKVLQNRIWGIKTADPLTLVAVSLVLTAVGLVACYMPARRATKVDPMVALRFE
jgi:predicted permease